MKPILWLGHSLAVLKSYDANVRREIGYNLDKIQHGFEPHDWRSVLSVGHGVREIRVHAGKEYRLIYVSQFENVIYVLHIFTKKAQKISKKDMEMIQRRYIEMNKLRGK